MDVGFRIARAVPKYLRDLIVKKNETKISFLKNKKQKEYKR
jgi:hypothetical protein